MFTATPGGPSVRRHADRVVQVHQDQRSLRGEQIQVRVKGTSLRGQDVVYECGSLTTRHMDYQVDVMKYEESVYRECPFASKIKIVAVCLSASLSISRCNGTRSAKTLLSSSC